MYVLYSSASRSDTGPFEFSFHLTRCMRGWYLCIELRTICKRKNCIHYYSYSARLKKLTPQVSLQHSACTASINQKPVFLCLRWKEVGVKAGSAGDEALFPSQDGGVNINKGKNR